MNRRKMIWVAILGIFLLAMVGLATAAPLAYDLSWNTMDGGGGSSSGGTYSLNGTIGQADAGAAMTGGNYSLQGGFWAGVPVEYRVYFPFTRQ